MRHHARVYVLQHPGNGGSVLSFPDAYAERTSQESTPLRGIHGPPARSDSGTSPMSVFDAVSPIVSLLKKVAPHDGEDLEGTVVLRQECSNVEDEIARLKLIIGLLEGRHAEMGRDIVSPLCMPTAQFGY